MRMPYLVIMGWIACEDAIYEDEWEIAAQAAEPSGGRRP